MLSTIALIIIVLLITALVFLGFRNMLVYRLHTQWNNATYNYCLAHTCARDYDKIYELIPTYDALLYKHPFTFRLTEKIIKKEDRPLFRAVVEYNNALGK